MNAVDVTDILVHGNHGELSSGGPTDVDLIEVALVGNLAAYPVADGLDRTAPNRRSSWEDAVGDPRRHVAKLGSFFSIRRTSAGHSMVSTVPWPAEPSSHCRAVCSATFSDGTAMAPPLAMTSSCRRQARSR